MPDGFFARVDDHGWSMAPRIPGRMYPCLPIVGSLDIEFSADPSRETHFPLDPESARPEERHGGTADTIPLDVQGNIDERVYPVSLSTSPSRPDLDETLSAYLAWLGRTGRLPSTKAAYGSRVRAFFKWLADSAELYVGALEDPDVRNYAARDYQSEQIEARRAPATIALHQASIADFYRWLQLGPPEVKRAEIAEPDAKALTRKQVQAVLRAAERRNVRDGALVNFLFYTAARVGETCKVNNQDFWIAPNGGEVNFIGKGNRQRTVTLNTDARAALRPWLKERASLHGGRTPGDPLFYTREGRRLTISAAEHVVREVGKAAKLRGPDEEPFALTPHTLRHSWATLYLQGDPDAKPPVPPGDIRTAQKILGHADVRTTMIYTQPSVQRLREAVDSVHIEV